MAAQPVSLLILGQTKEAHESTTLDAKHGATVVGASQSAFDDAIVIREQFAANNPFLDPKVAEHYRAIYEKKQYECRHVFDPDMEWRSAEERTLVRRLD